MTSRGPRLRGRGETGTLLIIDIFPCKPTPPDQAIFLILQPFAAPFLPSPPPHPGGFVLLVRGGGGLRV